MQLVHSSLNKWPGLALVFWLVESCTRPCDWGGGAARCGAAVSNYQSEVPRASGDNFRRDERALRAVEGLPGSGGGHPAHRASRASWRRAGRPPDQRLHVHAPEHGATRTLDVIRVPPHGLLPEPARASSTRGPGGECDVTGALFQGAQEERRWWRCASCEVLQLLQTQRGVRAGVWLPLAEEPGRGRFLPLPAQVRVSPVRGHGGQGAHQALLPQRGQRLLLRVRQDQTLRGLTF